MLFETHLKPDLKCTRESIGNSNETWVSRDVEINIYRRICRINVLQVRKGDFEYLLNSDLFASLVCSFPMIYLKCYYTMHRWKLKVLQESTVQLKFEFSKFKIFHFIIFTYAFLYLGKCNQQVGLVEMWWFVILNLNDSFWDRCLPHEFCICFLKCIFLIDLIETQIWNSLFHTEVKYSYLQLLSTPGQGKDSLSLLFLSPLLLLFLTLLKIEHVLPNWI